MTAVAAPDAVEAESSGPTALDKRRDAYIQLPHSLADDSRCGRIYGDDHLLATYVRMHLTADRMWPSAAPIPRIKATVMRALIDSETVQVVGHDRYRVPAVDELRARRKAAGRAGGQASGTSRGPKAEDPPNGRTDDWRTRR